MSEDGDLRVLPHDLMLEETLLGSCFDDQDVVDKITASVTPEMFYSDRHQILYKLICSVAEDGNKVDLISVSSKYRQEKVDQNVLSFSEMISINSKLNNNIDYSIAVLKELYSNRKIAIEAEKLVDGLYGGVSNLDDAMDLMAELQKHVIEVLSTEKTRHISEDAEESLVKLRERILNGSPAVPTMLESLNRVLVGFMQKELIIIGARPSVGKTALATSLARFQAENGYKVAFFSMEMDSVSLTDRVIIGMSGVDSYKYRCGTLKQTDLQKVESTVRDIKKLEIYIDPKVRATIPYIRSKIKRMINTTGCDIIYIDYLQIGGVNSKKARHEAVGDYAQGLKEVAKEFNIPVVALAQVNRDSEKRIGSGKRPGMADLKESSGIEAAADVIMFIHNPLQAGEVNPDPEAMPYEPDDVMLIVSKNRQGETKTVSCKTDKTRSNYYDIGEVREYVPEEERPDTGRSQEFDWDAAERLSENQQDNFDFSTQFESFESERGAGVPGQG